MMSDAVIDAVKSLQEQALSTCDHYEWERIELALDEILRQPASETPAQKRVWSARGHAYETLKRRGQIVPQASDGQEPRYVEGAFLMVEVTAWISLEPDFSAADRALLADLAEGWDAVMIAERDGVPLPRVRERISRCRSRARALRDKARLAA